MYSADFETIAGGLARREVGFLFGAGMSHGSGILLGSGMAKKMLRCAVFGETKMDVDAPEIDQVATSYPFEAISEYCRKKGSVQDLSMWLKRHGGFENPKETNAHSSLRELHRFLGTNFPQILFTTNFDTLIEDALKRDYAIPVTSENLVSLNEASEKRKVSVVHLHGSIEFPNSLISGEKDLATQEGLLFDLFKSELAKHVFIFVGYSLADTNLRKLFFDVQSMSETRKGLNKRTFVVSPASGFKGDHIEPRSEAGALKEIWQMRGADHIALSSEEFFKQLCEATQNFTVYKAKEYVAKKLGTDLNAIEGIAKSLAEQFKFMKWQDFILYLYYTL